MTLSSSREWAYYSANRPLKVLVSGPFGAGKTNFITAVSDAEPLKTEVPVRGARPGEKQTTTIGMDLGTRLLEDGRKVLIFGTPGQDRLEFMREILSTGMRGLVFLVDSTNILESAEQSRRMLATFLARRDVPLVVCANKQDLPGAWPIDDVRDTLGLNASTCVVGTTITDTATFREALLCCVAMIDRAPVFDFVDVLG
jgi:small GTP-binding protein